MLDSRGETAIMQFFSTGVIMDIKDFVRYEDGHLFWAKDYGRQTAGELVGVLTKGNYLRFHFDGRTFAVHRVIFYIHKGWWPNKVDHDDRDTLNNRIENLRPATDSQNSMNRTPKGKYLGVSLRNRKKPYEARIKVDGKYIYLGLHATEEEAARAYDRAAKEHFGEFANLNFPED